jgi:UbiD family decarboxylase
MLNLAIMLVKNCFYRLVFVSVTKAYTEMGKRKMPLFYKSPHPSAHHAVVEL